MTTGPEVAIQDIFSRTWEAFKKDAVLYIIAALIVMVVGTVTLGILAGPLTVGFIRLTRDRMKGQEVGAGDVFAGMSALIPSLIAVILIAIGVSIGTMLLVLPGLAVGVLCAFALHFIAYDDASVGDALKNSFELVKNNILLVIILMVLVGILNSLGSVVVVGVLVTAPFSMVAMNVAFEHMRGQG
jgi:membrane-anchored glycerophosphoryl diester phosphodiesterase (GDPDase)